VSKPGLPATVKMRHDLHYVEELSRGNRPIGKVIEIDRIEPNPEQPRTEIGDLTELSASIKEKGVLEPLLILARDDGKYMIIAGERRWRASRLAGLTEVPCIVIDTDEQGVAEIALIENLQRKDLNIWEEADGLKALAEKFGYTQDQIAQKISKSRPTVTELMSVAGLPQNIRDRCRELNIASKATLVDVARQFDEAAMLDYLAQYPEVRNQKVAKKVDKQNSAGNGGNSQSSSTTVKRSLEKTFVYHPEGARFSVTVSFDRPSDHSRMGVMTALKQAFDDVKSEKVDV
jgi:ParB family transcriptional regulator, chromosome partitioning protein